MAAFFLKRSAPAAACCWCRLACLEHCCPQVTALQSVGGSIGIDLCSLVHCLMPFVFAAAELTAPIAIETEKKKRGENLNLKKPHQAAAQPSVVPMAAAASKPSASHKLVADTDARENSGEHAQPSAVPAIVLAGMHKAKDDRIVVDLS
jgi:hypothetical protein